MDAVTAIAANGAGGSVKVAAETSPRGHDGPAKPLPGAAPCNRHLIVARRDCGATDGGSRCLVRLQVFTPDGSTLGPEITIDAATAGSIFHPAFAALAEGRFALAWEEAIGPDTAAQFALRVQVFNADGSPWAPVLAEAGAAFSHD